MAAPVPQDYAWLPGADRIEVDGGDAVAPADCAVILDTAPRSRTELAPAHYEAARRVVVIDHHAEAEPEGDFNFVAPEYAAVGEIIVELFDCLAAELNCEAALCAYVAQITDTGGYRFNNTNARSHRLAARLIEAGVDAGEVASRVLEDVHPARFRLVRRVYENMEFHADSRLACSTVTLADIAASGGGEEHTNNLANAGRNIIGVEVSLVFRETESGEIKVSVRSRPHFSAVSLAKRYGGGGHQAAAGFTVDGPLDQVKKRVIGEAKRMLDPCV
jgi:phosphoesterase RecJ-like protein